MTGNAGVARLIAVGDLQLGDSATCVGFGFRSRVPDRDLGAGLQRFAAAVGRAPLIFANLETPLSDLGLDRRRRRSIQLRGAPSYAEVLRTAGFTVLNVANNHALEHGADAFLDSVSRVVDSGIAVCGRVGTNGWAAQPVLQDAGGVQVGFLGYSLRPSSAAQGQRWHAQPSHEEIQADVRRVRSLADCVVVSLHWGEEFAPVPSASEVALAHAIVDAGAAVVLGHHPHVARPVERYGNAVIAYSLGNFIGDMIWYAPHREGLVLDCELTRQGVRSVRVWRSRVGDSFLPLVDTRDQVPVSQVAGLCDEEYLRLARITVQAQRRALYLYSLRNAWRFKPAILFELVASTVGGKASRLLRGRRDEIWG